MCSVAYIGCVLAMVGAMSSLNSIQRSAPSTLALLTTTAPFDLLTPAAPLDLPDLFVPKADISSLPELSSSSTDILAAEFSSGELGGTGQKLHSKKSRTNGLANILTLTLLKDTFLQFVTGVQDKLSSDPGSQTSTYGDRVPHVCTCGACPLVSDSSCWNQTSSQ